MERIVTFSDLLTRTGGVLNLADSSIAKLVITLCNVELIGFIRGAESRLMMKRVKDRKVLLSGFDWLEEVKYMIESPEWFRSKRNR
jgi:hypothetical protein